MIDGTGEALTTTRLRDGQQENCGPLRGSQSGTWYDTLPRSTKLPTVAGALIMAVVLMGFGVWGNMAPIAGAVVASGVFVVTGQNKIVQHLEGGMIREIYVREGDKVEAGQTIARA